MKKSFDQKMLQHFIGYTENRDEYQQSQIYRIVAQAGICAFYLSIILMGISLVIDVRAHQFTFGTFALFLVAIFISNFVLLRLRKSGLSNSEYSSATDYRRKITHLKKRSIYQALYFGIVMYVLTGYIFPTLAGEPIQFKWRAIIFLVAGTLVFGFGMYFASKIALKKVDDNEFK